MARPMSLAPAIPPPLACVILLHTPPKGGVDDAHYDLLVEPPAPFLPPDADRLWAARLPVPPCGWADAGIFPLLRIPPHRREYLTYEGPVSGGRGDVKRVDGGSARTLVWTADAIVWEMNLRGFQGRISLRRTAGEQWLVQADKYPIKTPCLPRPARP